MHGVQGKGSNVAPVTAPTKPSPPAQVGTIPSNGLGAGGNGFFAGVNGGANPFASPLFTQPQTWSGEQKGEGITLHPYETADGYGRRVRPSGEGYG